MLDRPSAAPVKRNAWVRVPPLALTDSGVAQPVEHLVEGEGAAGSIPAAGTVRVHDVTWQPATLPWWMRGFKSPWTLLLDEQLQVHVLLEQHYGRASQLARWHPVAIRARRKPLQVRVLSLPLRGVFSVQSCNF